MSLEIDDEETSRAQIQVRYEGEDVSATTNRELNGWYAYPIAAEVFAVVAVGNYNMPHITRYLRSHSPQEHFYPSYSSSSLAKTGTSSQTARSNVLTTAMPDQSGCAPKLAKKRRNNA